MNLAVFVGRVQNTRRAFWAAELVLFGRGFLLSQHLFGLITSSAQRTGSHRAAEEAGAGSANSFLASVQTGIFADFVGTSRQVCGPTAQNKSMTFN